jgi:putative restriction endonuclease
MPNLNDYLQKLTHLKRGITKYGLAPHNPILLITLLELISNVHLVENRVSVDTDLVGIFQENWRLLVNTLHQPDFTQPFQAGRVFCINGRKSPDNGKAAY